ncbi:hypothetical protein MKW92_028957 [Papaver armeniacum]|nr:hypothetical protein MKW92_028957 [Papaver armeniacum]
MWYLCVFFHRLLDYRKSSDLRSTPSYFVLFFILVYIRWKLPLHHHPDCPYHFVSLPSEQIASNIAKRSILVKGIYELWGEGGSYEELEEAIKSYPDDLKAPYMTSDNTFRIIIDSFGNSLTFQEQNERIPKFAFIPFKGKVNLKKPDHKFWVMETDNYGSKNNGLPPVAEKRIFFGREIGTADRKLLPTYQLKSRNYLGFSKEVGFFVLFFLKMFDAIICDPPYGVFVWRSNLVGGNYSRVLLLHIPDDKRIGHVTLTAPYSLAECVHDLLDLAAEMLVMGGRLVFFYPVLSEDASSEPSFPEHPCFSLLAVSEQILSFRYSRFLLTMVKTGSYTKEVAEEATKMHLDFKENHLKWLEEGNLHSAVFCPNDLQTDVVKESKSNSDPSWKYRGKYVYCVVKLLIIISLLNSTLLA